MRRYILSVIVLTGVAFYANAQKVVTYKEAADPVPVSERSIAAWETVGKLKAQWVSADSLYSRSEVPMASNNTCNLDGWKGERVSAQILLWSATGLNNIQCKVKDLVGDNGKINASATQARFVRYTLADEGGENCRCERGPLHPMILAPDMLDSLKVFNMDPKTVRPVWITVDIPQDAKPGVYKSTVEVTAKGAKASLPFELEVINQTLPTADQWGYHLDLWQHPSAVARIRNLELWSDEHFAAIKEEMAPLANAGQKVITATLNRDPWGSQCFDDYESMIIWTHKKDGSWSYVYTNFDKYVELMMSLGVKKQINCYSMLPWNKRICWYEEKSGAFVEKSRGPQHKDFESLWGPFLTDFVKHLEEKGWLEITNIAADERAPEDMEVVIKVMNKYAPQLGFAMADNHASYRRIQNVRDCCVAQRQLYLTQEEIDERRAKGYVTTFYVCCSTFFPNTWTFSQPWESELLSWHALSKDYDGQLRWAYNSWPARPEYDSRFRRWGSGDTFQVYPCARSTMRFERFRDGIEAYEKMHILRKKYAGNPALQPLEEHLAKMASLKLTDKSLPWDEMVDQAQELLNSISRQLAE